MKVMANLSSEKHIDNLAWSGKRHLLDTKDLSKDEVIYLINRAKYFKEQLNSSVNTLSSILTGKVAANLFYEYSTRTRLSFELASKRLGMQVLNLDISRSSVQKGESLIDTALTLAAMGVNVIIQRHAQSGSAAQIAGATANKVHVINAGEGVTDHPTQALLDVFTMLEAAALEGKIDLSGSKIVIVGDILHSRVAKSSLWLPTLFGAQIHLVGPAQLLPQALAASGAILHDNLDEALKNADFIMTIRPQFERQESGIFGGVDTYVSSYQINHERLKRAKPSVKIIAPGPINRDVEISGKVADDHALSLIERQVENGVPMRMAVLEALCGTD